MKAFYISFLCCLVLTAGKLSAQAPNHQAKATENSPEFCESTGYQIENQNLVLPMPDASKKSRNEIPPGGLLLIPNSADKTVIALNPQTGELVNAAFFPADATNLSTPIHLLYNGSSFFISDQVKNLVQEFNINGIFQGTFAPIGGANTAIMQNIRGMFLRENGNLLVSVAGGGNTNSIAEFDNLGNYLGNFVANNAGGLNSPWDIVYRPNLNDYLISGGSSNAIHRFDANGASLGTFASGLNFPEQMCLLSNGNILVATFSNPSGVYEFNSQGVQIGYYGVVGSLRGVYELPDGNILVTNSSGIHKINRANQNLGTIVAGNARFITHVLPASVIQVNLREGFNIMINYSANLGENLEIIGGEEPYTYAWTLSGSDWTSTEADPNFSFEETGSHVFTLTVTDVNEDTGSAQLTVFVYPELIADAGVDKYAMVAQNTTLGGTNSATGGMAPHDFFWTLEGNSWTSNSSNPVVSFDQKGNYVFNVLVTDSEGNTANDQMTLTVYEALQADAGDDQSVFTLEDFTLGGNPAAIEGIAPYTYLWSLEGSSWTSSEANPEIAMEEAGTYSFSLTVTDAINNTASDQTTISVSIDNSIEQPKENDIAIFPNPASKHIHLEFPDHFSGEIFIVDIQGREVLKQSGNGKTIELDISSLAEGMFFIKAGSWKIKFIVKH